MVLLGILVIWLMIKAATFEVYRERYRNLHMSTNEVAKLVEIFLGQNSQKKHFQQQELEVSYIDPLLFLSSLL